VACDILQTFGELSLSKHFEATFDAFPYLVQRIRTDRHLIVDLKPRALAHAGWLTRAWSGIALGSVRRSKIDRLFRIADANVKKFFGKQTFVAFARAFR